jgi:hypothetical protein
LRRRRLLRWGRASDGGEGDEERAGGGCGGTRPPARAAATDYYVRQTVGDDSNDGLSAAAWRRVARLAPMMKAGDTAYVGPGLYREEIVVLNDGSPGRRLVFIADTSGQHTGDPPGGDDHRSRTDR